MSVKNQTDVFNIVFVPNLDTKNILNSMAKYHHQEHAYCFICGSENLVFDYSIHIKLLKILRPAIKFRLVCLLESQQKDKEIRVKLLEFNKYHQQFKLKCFYLNQLNVKNLKPGIVNPDYKCLTSFHDLYYHPSHPSIKFDVLHRCQFLDQHEKELKYFLNAINFWKRFHAVVMQCSNISQCVPVLNDSNQSFTNVILVDDYQSAIFWTNLVAEFSSQPSQYLFIPNSTNSFIYDKHIFDGTLKLFDQTQPTNLNVKLFALLGNDAFGTINYNYLKNLSNKKKQFKLRVYSLKSLNLNKKMFHLDQGYKLYFDGQYMMRDLYKISEPKEAHDSTFHPVQINIDQPDPIRCEQECKNSRNQIWKNLVRIIELK